MINPKKYFFPKVIQSITDHEVRKFDPTKSQEQEILELLTSVIEKVGKQLNREGIEAPRPNEAGSRIEPFLKEALKEGGFQANTPITKTGKRKKAGYPNIELSYKDWFGYLDCKTYASGQEGSSLRTFYLSPSEEPKVTKDASHLLLSFKLERKGRRYFPKSWHLYDLYNLKVELKEEYNASNRDIYQKKELLIKEKLVREETLDIP